MAARYRSDSLWRRIETAGEEAQVQRVITYQQPLFPYLIAGFPSTRYQGSKAKLGDWIPEVPYRGLEQYRKWRERATQR
jgi:hypothetical protein